MYPTGRDARIAKLELTTASQAQEIAKMKSSFVGRFDKQDQFQSRQRRVNH